MGPAKSYSRSGLIDMPAPKRVIVEMVSLGNVVKVMAICEDTGREVSIVGDPKAPKKQLEALAVRKLTYVMEKEDKDRPAGRGFTV
jgi:hypothetical protein